MKRRVKVDGFPYLRVRSQPSLTASVLGGLAPGAEVDVVDISGDWAAIALQAGGARVGDIGDMAAPAVAYVFAGYLVGEAPPPPPPASKYALGVNVISNTGVAMRWAALGCRYFVIIDDFAAASELKRRFPDAVVMARRWFGNEIPSVDRAIDRLEGASDPGLIYTGINEGDGLGQSDDDLKRRAHFDVLLAERIRATTGARYAGGSFSMGAPDYTNDSVCQLMRSVYAPAYNAGVLGLDMHLYSPTPAHIQDEAEWIWYERRWEFLFTKCGFDPRVRAIYCSETGLDEGGIGGFPQHASTQEQFRSWCARFIDAQSRPLVVAGQSYPSPAIGGAIFQAGDSRTSSGGWAGYNIEGYVDTFKQFWT